MKMVVAPESASQRVDARCSQRAQLWLKEVGSVTVRVTSTCVVLDLTVLLGAPALLFGWCFAFKR